MATAIKRKVELPLSFRRIRLELAREPGHPIGSSQNGYEIIAPLDREGRIDAGLWREHRRACGMLRFRSGEPDDIGHLVHKPGGAWSFHYDAEGHDDETGYRFGDEHFTVGEYVSVTEGDTQHTYRVVSVERP